VHHALSVEITLLIWLTFAALLISALFHSAVELSLPALQGWNKKATVEYVLHEYEESLQDCQRCVAAVQLVLKFVLPRAATARPI